MPEPHSLDKDWSLSVLCARAISTLTSSNASLWHRVPGVSKAVLAENKLWKGLIAEPKWFQVHSQTRVMLSEVQPKYEDLETGCEVINFLATVTSHKFKTPLNPIQ